MAVGRRGVAQALKGYAGLNELAVRCLRPGGTLVTCSCTGRVSREAFVGVLASVEARTGRRQIVPETSIGASYGDAFLAGLAAGIIPDLEALHRDWVRIDRVIEPDPVRGALYDDYFAVYRSLYPQTRDAMHRLADLGRRDPSNRPESSG